MGRILKSAVSCHALTPRCYLKVLPFEVNATNKMVSIWKYLTIGGAGFRTPDATDMSRMLYHLSYTAGLGLPDRVDVTVSVRNATV